jgi:hypothetical protein
MWNEFLERCKLSGLRVYEPAGTVWDEAGYEHKPLARTDVKAAFINGITVILENPDGRMYCFLVLGEGIKADQIREIWDRDAA